MTSATCANLDCHPRASRYPVSRGLSMNSQRLWNTGSPAFAGNDVRWERRRQIRHFKIKPVPQILARFEDALDEGAVGLARHQGLDQVELIHRDELQDLGAEFSGGIARQDLHHLDMLRRFWTVRRREIAAQLRFERGLVGLDEGIESDAAAAAREAPQRRV